MVELVPFLVSPALDLDDCISAHNEAECLLLMEGYAASLSALSPASSSALPSSTSRASAISSTTLTAGDVIRAVVQDPTARCSCVSSSGGGSVIRGGVQGLAECSPVLRDLGAFCDEFHPQNEAGGDDGGGSGGSSGVCGQRLFSLCGAGAGSEAGANGQTKGGANGIEPTTTRPFAATISCLRSHLLEIQTDCGAVLSALMGGVFR